MFDLIFAFVFVLVSMVPIIIGIVSRSHITRNCTVAVEAVIESYESHYSHERHHIIHVPIYGYYFNGVHYNASAKSRLGQRGIGVRQILYINPYNPQQCYKKEDLFIPNMALGIGIFMGILSLGFLCRIILDLLLV